MPKLIYFLACDRILLNEESPTPSLISVFEQISVPPPPVEVDTPQAGMHWVLVSHWRKTPEDAGKTFQQRTCILSPVGEISAEVIIEFTISNISHRNTVKIFGFPLKPAGEYHAQLFIREVSHEEWIQAGDYSIFVNYVQ